MNVIRLKVEIAEFELAKADGCVYGRALDLRSKQPPYSPFSAYVELGKEQVYKYRENEDVNLKCRMFKNCTASFAYSDEMADLGDYFYTVSCVSVIVYM
jgi:hypothetical protein